MSFRNNPAYTGNSDLNDLMIITRQQWTGFEGAPTSYLLAAHFSLRDKNASIGADIRIGYAYEFTTSMLGGGTIRHSRNISWV